MTASSSAASKIKTFAEGSVASGLEMTSIEEKIIM